MYKNKYDDEDADFISDDQTDLYYTADVCWLAMSFASVFLFVGTIVEHYNIESHRKEYEDVIEEFEINYHKEKHKSHNGGASDKDKSKKKLKPDQNLIEGRGKSTLKYRFIVWLLFSIAMIALCSVSLTLPSFPITINLQS